VLWGLPIAAVLEINFLNRVDSLLAGFKKYSIVGTSASLEHCWVLTRQTAPTPLLTLPNSPYMPYDTHQHNDLVALLTYTAVQCKVLETRFAQLDNPTGPLTMIPCTVHHVLSAPCEPPPIPLVDLPLHKTK